ncbi:unnamed protein product [Gulo gulo]|uniref:Uncharacterized protein n=1 Tax=Gulo gulo TaxID=48420 RepID=A0A9X9PUL8_GULGU|nr:unnamed protein product [Gulo gulo]
MIANRQKEQRHAGVERSRQEDLGKGGRGVHSCPHTHESLCQGREKTQRGGEQTQASWRSGHPQGTWKVKEDRAGKHPLPVMEPTSPIISTA